MLETKRFTKNDNGFTCENCGFTVLPLGRTSRNHCPRCLCSKHVDVLPGDRANTCGGTMDPVGAEPDARRGYVVIHKCRKCGALTRNKAALDDGRGKLDPSQYDDLDKLIALTVNGNF